jgi:glutamyl-Q tRNA(Asp) synthetase
MEDLDTPRVVAGSADEILGALVRYGLDWDGEVVLQSQRTHLYETALRTLRERNLAYDCGCSRAELQRAPSAPVGAEAVYPGFCRDGLPPGRAARAVRFRAPSETIAFEDAVRGRAEEEVSSRTGDFVIKRADGLFAYQLAVVVDDAEQEVTQVVRGGDLLTSTGRQIALQRALGYRVPAYAHLPLIVDASGAKLGKRDGALPLPSLDAARVASTLAVALELLGIPNVTHDTPGRMLAEALHRFSPSRVPHGPLPLPSR